MMLHQCSTRLPCSIAILCSHAEPCLDQAADDKRAL